MKVLLIDEGLCWPLDSGKKLRSYNLLARLAPHHEISLLAYQYGSDSEEAKAQIERLGVSVSTVPAPPMPKEGPPAALRVVQSALRGLPYSAALYGRPIMARAIRETVRRLRLDLVHLEITTMGQPIPRSIDAPMVLNAHNCETRIWERLASNESNPIKAAVFWSQARLMRRFERDMLRRCQHVCPVSAEDQRSLSEFSNRPRFTVVPNGVDLDFYGYDSNQIARHSIVFTGALDWRPMQEAVVHFLEEIYPRVREKTPDATATIAGRHPPDWLRQIVAEHPDTRLLANVPDIRVPLREASVAIAPIKSGSGSRLKILEALAIGRPVVATRVGAEGLGLEHGKHLLLADEPDEFAENVCRLWQDELMYEKLRANGRAIVEKNFGWDSIAETMGRVWDSVGARTSNPGVHQAHGGR